MMHLQLQFYCRLPFLTYQTVNYFTIYKYSCSSSNLTSGFVQSMYLNAPSPVHPLSLHMYSSSSPQKSKPSKLFVLLQSFTFCFSCPANKTKPKSQLTSLTKPPPFVGNTFVFILLYTLKDAFEQPM